MPQTQSTSGLNYNYRRPHSAGRSQNHDAQPRRRRHIGNARRPTQPTAAAWYYHALEAAELCILGSVVGLQVEGAAFFVGEPAKNGWDIPANLGAVSARVELFCDNPDGLVANRTATSFPVGARATRPHPMLVANAATHRHQQACYRPAVQVVSCYYHAAVVNSIRFKRTWNPLFPLRLKPHGSTPRYGQFLIAHRPNDVPNPECATTSKSAGRSDGTGYNEAERCIGNNLAEEAT